MARGRIQSSRPNLQWQRTYGGSERDKAHSVIETRNGNYLLAGWTLSYGGEQRNAWLLNVAPDGTEQWNRAYGGEGDDEAKAVVETSRGNYLLAGSTEADAEANPNAWLAKVGQEGDLRWRRRYGSSYLDFGQSVATTSDGHFLFTAVKRREDQANGALLVKIAPDGVGSEGSQQWARTYGGDRRPAQVIETSDGDYLVAGYDHSGNDSSAVWLMKVRPDGEPRWSNTYSTTDNGFAASVVESRSGDYLAAGWTQGNPLLVKVRPDGTERWSNTYGSSEKDGVANSVVEAQGGGYIMAGYQGVEDRDVSLVGVATDGTEVWTQTYGSSRTDEAKSITATIDGHYLVAGETEPESGRSDAWLGKVSAAVDGGQTATSTLQGPDATGTAVATDQYDLRAGEVTKVQPRSPESGASPETYYVISRLPGTDQGVRRAVTTTDYELVADPHTIRDALWVANYVNSQVVPDIQMWRRLQEYSRNRRNWLNFTENANRLTEVLVNVGEIAILVKTLGPKAAVGAVVDGLTDAVTWAQTALDQPYKEAFTRIAQSSKNLEWIETREAGPSTADWTDDMEQYAELMAGLYGQVDTMSNVASVWASAFSRQGYKVVYTGVSVSALSEVARGMAIGLALNAATAPLEGWFRANARIDGILSALHAVRLPIIQRIIGFEQRIADHAISPRDLYRYHVYKFTHYQMTALASSFVAKKYEAMNGAFGRLQAADGLASQHVDRMETNRQLAALASTGLGATWRDVERRLTESINAEVLGGVGE